MKDNVAESSVLSTQKRNKEDTDHCISLMENILKVGFEEEDITRISR